MGKLKDRARIRSALSGYQRTVDMTPATMGNASGIVSVPGRAGYVYVQPSASTDAVAIYNKRVPPKAGARVWIGYDPAEPSLLQVLGSREITGQAGGTLATGAHAANHQYFGGDVVYVDKRQYLPARVSPGTGISVNLHRDIAWVGGWVSITSQTVDLTTYVPTTSDKACFVLLSITGAGEISVLRGWDTDISTSSISDIPEPLADTLPLAAVRLYNGMTQIVESYTYTDIVDLRGYAYIARPEVLQHAVTCDGDIVIDGGDVIWS